MDTTEKARLYFKEYNEIGLPEEYIEKYESVRELILTGVYDDMPMLSFARYVIERESQNVNT